MADVAATRKQNFRRCRGDPDMVQIHGMSPQYQKADSN